MKVIEHCRVAAAPAPDKSSNPTSFSIPLTFFDLLWLRLPPVQRIFFYEFPHTPSLFFHSLLPNLKHSLSLALRYFSPLSGHLTWPHDSTIPIVKCEAGDSVSVIVAESDADFIRLSGFDDLCEATECHHLIPHLTISHERSSVLALQVTLFPNSGFCIGITSHHAVLDGKTSTLFLKSWAYLCNKLKESSCSLEPQLIPFYDRGGITESLEKSKALEEKYVNDWLREGGPNNRSLSMWNLQVPSEAVRGVFELTRTQIDELKKVVTAKQKHKQNYPLSSFILACAYSWVCRAKAEEMTDNTHKVQYLGINVDCRSRWDPPLPPTYLGNCVVIRLAVAETKRLVGEDGLVVGVEAICGALETLKDGVLSEAETWVELLHGGLNSDARVSGIAGSPRFEIYGADFGWGTPKKVDMASIDRTGAICVSDSRNGHRGIEVSLVLKKGVMQAFASLFLNDLKSL